MTNYLTLFNLLRKTENSSFYFFILISLIGMVFEIMSIGIIIPILSQIINPTIIQDFPMIIAFLELISPINLLNSFFLIDNSISYQLEIIISMILVLILFFILKFFFMVFLEWTKSSYVFGIYKNLGQEVFYKYLNQPLMFHNLNNSGVNYFKTS